MVKKLFKYEFIFYLRTLLPVQIILIGLAALNRVIQLFENNSLGYDIAFVSSAIALAGGIIASIVLTTVIIVSRFYKNMFSSEGYLTHTLPVTATQHILVKLATAMIFNIATFLSVIVAGVIATLGDVLNEVIKAIEYLYNKVYLEYVGTHGIFYIIEFLLLILATSAMGILLFYACITVGQLFNKNRIFAAVGVYFAYYVIVEAIETTIVLSGSLLYDALNIQKLVDIIAKNPLPAIHWIAAIIIVFSIVVSLVYFFVIKFIIKRKLNLE